MMGAYLVENARKEARLRLSLVLLGTKQELLAKLVVSSETQPHKTFDCTLLFPVAYSFLSPHLLQLVVQLATEQALSSSLKIHHYTRLPYATS